MLAPSSLLLCTERSFRFFQETSTASWHCAGSQRHVLRNSPVPVSSADPSGANRSALIPVASTHSSTCSNVSRSHSFTTRSVEPVASNSSFGWNSTLVTAPSCGANSFRHRPAARSHSRVRPSWPPLTTHLPSGENLHTPTPRSWPLYVWMHPFLRTSQTFRFVSSDPEAKNSPNGWKSTDWQLERCPTSVRTALACSRSQSFRVPPAAPATTTSSLESNVTHSTADWWPAMDRIALGLPTAKRFTRLSSPPVTMTPEDLRPIWRQFTALVCAANS